MIDVEEKSAIDGKVVSCNWIDHLKRPDLVRSRLVAQEVVKGKKREDVFAGTPPLAAFRLLLQRAASRGRNRNLAIYDVSVAFFHADMTEAVYVRPPRSLRRANTLWKLRKAMYGTQVASSLWQSLVRKTLEAGGWEPTVFVVKPLHQVGAAQTPRLVVVGPHQGELSSKVRAVQSIQRL